MSCPSSSSSFSACVADGCMEEPVLLHPLQGLHSLQALVPSLLRCEVEVALEKLDLIWDRTFAWDMFLDMMVRGCGRRALNGFTYSSVSKEHCPHNALYTDPITNCLQEGQPRRLAQTKQL